MISCWLSLLEQAGWHTPIEEITWCTTGPNEAPWRVHVRGTEVRRASREIGFKALGVQITFDNQFHLELEARIKRAWASFYKFYDVLCCHGASLKKRFALLSMFVHPTLFWCAGSWNLTTKQLAKLRKVQCSMLRKMISPKQASNESRADFMHRSASLIKNLMTRHGVERWHFFHRNILHGLAIYHA